MKADNTELEKAREWWESLDDDQRSEIAVSQGGLPFDICMFYQLSKSETSQAATPDLCCGMYSHVEGTQNPETTVTYATGSTPESVEQAAAEFASGFYDKSQEQYVAVTSEHDGYYEVENAFLAGAEWQSEQSPSTCQESLQVQKESQGDVAELVEALRQCVDVFDTIRRGFDIDRQKMNYSKLTELIKKFEPKQ